MTDHSRDTAAKPQADTQSNAHASREWIKPEIVTLDLETAQATGPVIPGG